MKARPACHHQLVCCSALTHAAAAFGVQLWCCTCDRSLCYSQRSTGGGSPTHCWVCSKNKPQLGSQLSKWVNQHRRTSDNSTLWLSYLQQQCSMSNTYALQLYGYNDMFCTAHFHNKDMQQAKPKLEAHLQLLQVGNQQTSVCKAAKSTALHSIQISVLIASNLLPRLPAPNPVVTPCLLVVWLCSSGLCSLIALPAGICLLTIPSTATMQVRTLVY